MTSPPTIRGFILAGGRAARLGGIDKGAIAIGGRSAFARVHARLDPWIEHISVSVSADDGRNDYQGFDVVPDMTQAADGGPGFVILTCMRGAAGSGASYALTCPVDTPFLPADFVPRLIATLEAGDPNAPAVAVCDGRVHGLHALWPVSRCADLDMLLDDPAKRKVELLHRELGSTPCIFDSGEGAPPFLNLNRPDDIERAQRFADSGA